jgi:multidrug efflux pump subunit AcrA (membrane-fusion protein)
VPEAARAALKPGARVRVEAISGQAFSDDARVAVVLPSADASTRRIPVEIRVPNRDRRFVAHTLARATLSLGDEQVAASLPSTALASAGGDHVFVFDNGVARKVMVTVLDRGAERVTVQGLPRNARVIDSPALDLEEGASLEVKQ